MSRVSRQNIMDFSGLYFKMRGLLGLSEEPVTVAAVDEGSGSDVDTTAREKINEVIAKLEEVGVFEEAE